MITMSLPPPGRNDLWDLERQVGWIGPDGIGFSGFADRAAAAQAAWIAHVALAQIHARRNDSPVPELGTPALGITRDGEGEHITADGEPFASLITPSSPRAIADGWFGFSIGIPDSSDELAGRSAAHAVYHALRRSGTPWAARTGASPTPPRRPTVLLAPWRLRDLQPTPTNRFVPDHALTTQEAR